ncbi:MAG: AsmA-like C-terminal region-containing protein [Acidobacteriota bacterium]
MPAKPKKLILVAAVALVVLALGVVAVLFTEFDSPELGRLALNQIGQSAGLELQAEGFRLNLLRGLELENVQARGPLEDGELTATMDRLVLKHRPGDLLGGTLTVTEIVLERPQVELVAGERVATRPTEAASTGGSASDDSSVAESSEGEGSSLDLAISEVRLEDGSIVQRSTQNGVTESMELRGLDLQLTDLTFGGDVATGQTARGEIRIDEIVLGDPESSDPAALTTVRGVEIEIGELTLDPAAATHLAGAKLSGDATIGELISGETQARDASARMELEGGQLGLRDLRLTAPQGELQGHLEADVAADPMTYSLRLDGDALSTGVLLGLGNIAGLGTSQFELSATGNADDATALLGNGRLTIGSGELPDHPVFTQLEAILGNVALIGAGFDSFPLEFDIRQQRLHLAECRLSAGPVAFTVSGWLDFDGPLEMQLSVLTPREGLSIKEIPVEVLDVLAEEDGRVNLPMLIRGSADLTQVGLNRDTLAKLGKRYAQKTVERELTKALTGLFSRRDDDDS